MSTNVKKRMGGQPDLMKLKTGVHDMRAWGEGVEHNWYAVVNEAAVYLVQGYHSRTSARTGLIRMKAIAQAEMKLNKKAQMESKSAPADVLVFELKPVPDSSIRPLAIPDMPMVNADETIARVMDQEMRPMPQATGPMYGSRSMPPITGRLSGGIVWSPNLQTCGPEMYAPPIQDMPTKFRYSKHPKSVIQISAGGCRVRYQDPRTGKLGEWQEF